MKLEREDKLENAALLAVVAFAALVIVPAILRADESPDYWRSKAASAIAIQGERGGVSPPVLPPIEATPKSETKPVLQVFYAPFPCPPCDDQKSSIKDWTDAPFTFETPAKCPIEIRSYPLTVWRVENKYWYVEGWHGRKDLVERWKHTQRGPPPVRARSNPFPNFAGYYTARQWPDWPDYNRLRSHLKAIHGVYEASELTNAQADAVHDLIHRGWTAATLRAQYK